MRKLIVSTFIISLLFSICVFGFTDVNEGDWFYENVTEMASENYLRGYTDGSFRPRGIITKAEFTSIVARISDLNDSPASAGHWASPLMQSALYAGYYDWDEIPPTGETYDLPISRQLAIKIVMKAFLPDAKGEYNDIAKFPDLPELDGRYYEAVAAAAANGILLGDEKGRLNPKSNLTRAEACAVISRATGKKDNPTPLNPPLADETPVPQKARSGGVSENGSLSVIGTGLCNQRGEPVVLRGMSSHGLHWYGNFVTGGALSSLADRGANLIRLAMYTGEGGYLSDKSVKDTLIKAADEAIKQDMYVIIDWHILSDNDPLSNVDAAEEFFRDISKRYAANPAVIYEICNEPNGNISWSGNVKPYAERIIKVIRENSSGVILVGSTTWSQDLHIAAADPIRAENIMYTCHFYAGTHSDWLRQRIADCGLPVFVSEWGVSAADGNGGVFLEEAQKWIDFMKERNISWANWSLCDKNESSAALKSGANASDGIDPGELSESGKFVFGNFK